MICNKWDYMGFGWIWWDTKNEKLFHVMKLSKRDFSRLLYMFLLRASSAISIKRFCAPD